VDAILSLDTKDLKKTFSVQIARKPGQATQPITTAVIKIKRSSIDQNNFSNKGEDIPPDEENSGVAFYHSIQGDNFQRQQIDQSVSTQIYVEPTENKLKGATGKDEPIRYIASVKTPAKKKVPAIPFAISTSHTSVTSQVDSPLPNNCSADVSSATLSHPIGVNLTCSQNAEIKYCVSNTSTCCDPISHGVTYTSKITIGANDGTYCLSFYGITSNGETDIYEETYTINSILPDLQVGNPQIYFQTTELPGISFITSNDFGKANYIAGEINMRNHDPSPSGENLSCEEIVDNYIGLPVPTPFSFFSLQDLSTENPATQIEIPFASNNLDYGDNFLTSYIVNNNYVSPLYSCSTTRITLQDFEFFSSGDYYGNISGVNNMDFSGGFNSYGFFENENTLYRGPAGVDSETNSGQKLKHGLFGIIY